MGRGLGGGRSDRTPAAIPARILARSPTSGPRPFREPPTQAAGGGMAHTSPQQFRLPSPRRGESRPAAKKFPPISTDALS